MSGMAGDCVRSVNHRVGFIALLYQWRGSVVLAKLRSRTAAAAPLHLNARMFRKREE